MKIKFSLIIGLITLLALTAYCLNNNKNSNIIGDNVTDPKFAKSSGSKYNTPIVSDIENQEAKEFQKYNHIDKIIEFYKDGVLVGEFSIDDNNPFEINKRTKDEIHENKYSLLESDYQDYSLSPFAIHASLHEHVSIATVNKIGHSPKFIAVSYFFSSLALDGKNEFISTIKILNTKGVEVKKIQLVGEEFIAKSISPDLNLLFGLSLSEKESERYYPEFIPKLIHIPSKENLWESLNLTELVSGNSEYTYAVFPYKDKILIANENTSRESLFLLNMTTKNIEWSKKLDFNKETLEVKSGFIYISKYKSDQPYYTKKITN